MHMTAGGEVDALEINFSLKQQISFVVHSPHLCIIKRGGASPESLSGTSALLATVNMLDENRRFKKKQNKTGEFTI